MADREVCALVVEDDPSWQQILVEILADSGLVVDLAGSAPEAETMIHRTSHRLAVLDLSLGGTDHRNQDGLRVAEAIRKHDPGCVILFLTGFATVELAVQVMQDFGAYTCLRKEVFRRSDFRKVIQQALAKPQTAAAEADRDPAESPTSASQSESNAGLSVLVIEDDAGWRDLLGELLADAGLAVRACGSYVEAIGSLRREHCDLAVIDLSLASSQYQENQDGYRLLSVMHKAGIPVIIVSGYAEPERIEQAYAERLIYACLEKQGFDRKTFKQTVTGALASGAEDPVLARLTEREREVLVLLASGMTNKEIARELTITQNTVKRHLKSLFAKLNVSTRSAASAWATSKGFGK
jgi:DNA-binding NarL/FixJ family response regulator